MYRKWIETYDKNLDNILKDYENLDEEIDLSMYNNRYYSQNGEDGIIYKLVSVLPIDSKTYVEFGVEDGRECNTLYLRKHLNWEGIMLDGNNENHNINLYKHFITKDNIIELLQKYNTPINIGLLSVDIDFNDFYVLHSILKGNYRPNIIICEFNACHLPDEDKVIIYKEDYMWDGTNYFGASLLSLYNLCNKFNYSLVGVDNKSVNAFFVRNDLIGSLQFKNINNINIYNTWCHPRDEKNRDYIMSHDIITNE